MKPSIYVITHHLANHEREGKLPLDKRFLQTDKNYIFFLIDSQIPKELSQKKVLKEKEIDLEIHECAKRYFAEWSFLFAEERHAFCDYPFFMISSRFYEKNHFLMRDLNHEWERLFDFLNQYGWGYLPSYNLKLKWVDLLTYKKKRERHNSPIFFPFTDLCCQTVSQIFEIDFPNLYRYMPFLFCNYVGFKSRKHLEEYLRFYKPLIHHFFDAHLHPKVEIKNYVSKTGLFYQEKPFAFLLEYLSHLFFYKTKHPYFTLHYDGYYEIGEAKMPFKKIYRFPLAKKVKLEWYLKRKWWNLKSLLKHNLFR